MPGLNKQGKMKANRGKGVRKQSIVLASPRPRATIPTSSEMLEATLKTNDKLRVIFSKHFNVPLDSLPKPDPTKSALERKQVFISHILDLYNAHLTDLSRRASNLRDQDSLTAEERHKLILKIPAILEEIGSVLEQLKSENPEAIRKYNNKIHLTLAMSDVITELFRFFDGCLTSSRLTPEYLPIIEQAINFYEHYGENTVCVKFDTNNRGEISYLCKMDYSYTTACVLYHTYLNVYLSLKEAGNAVPSEQHFLKYAKEFKKKQKEFAKLRPDVQFVPNPDVLNKQFSLFNYYSVLVNYYQKEPEKYFHYLTKMMDAREDFNLITANGAIFEKINYSLASEQDLKRHLLLLSLGIKIIDNHLEYFQSLDARRRLSVQDELDWFYQSISNVGLEEFNLPRIRQQYYSLYIEAVLRIAQEQRTALEELAKTTKLNSFLDKIEVQVHSNPKTADTHDVYAELDLVIKDERFVNIIIDELERINIPCRLNGNLTISIEAALFEINTHSLKKALLNAARSCRNAERKRIDKLLIEEREKAFATEQFKKEEQLHTNEHKLEMGDKSRKEESEKVYEKEGKEKPATSHKHGKKPKAHYKEKEKEKEKEKVSSKGSFFNPRKPKSDSLPPFEKLPPGTRVHNLRSPGSGCKYWVCIHPCLIQQMTREHKIPELNRLNNQLREGGLGKGKGVRGIIEGNNIKWDDPSRNCRYYGLVAEEYHDKSGKHVLFMMTTKVDEHSKKTPNIIIPPELKAKNSKGFSL